MLLIQISRGINFTLDGAAVFLLRFLFSRHSSCSASRSAGCEFRPAVQSGGCWSPSVGPWWRPAPPAVCPARPSSWRSVPRPSWCRAPPAASPAAAGSPAARRAGLPTETEANPQPHNLLLHSRQERGKKTTSISTLCKREKELPSKMHLITTSASDF